MGTKPENPAAQTPASSKPKAAKEASLEQAQSQALPQPHAGHSAPTQTHGVAPPIPGVPPPKPKTVKEAAADAEAGQIFLQEALKMAKHLEIDTILFITEKPIPEEVLSMRSVKKKIIVATSSEKIRALCDEKKLRSVQIPAYAFDRFEKIKIGLASCTSAGMVADNMRVLCLAGHPHTSLMDTCMVTRIGEDSEERAALGVLNAGTEFKPQVLEAVLHLALTIGYEGFEGSPVGTIFAIGDCTTVMEKSRQLTLNPFQGYSEEEKNILDPRIRDAIKNFSLLDGAFVIREDGVVMAAGRYLQAPQDMEINLPLGFGTRNAAAMAITKSSKAIAFVVSKTTGAVRIYKNGTLALELRQERRRPA